MDLHWLPVEYRIIYKILLLVYKAINGFSPSYISNRPFATNDHMVQNPPYWRASSLLFPQWYVKTKRPQPVKLDLPLF